MSEPHRFTLRVYYEDTDAAGIVYHANYLKFAERARTELLRRVGLEQDRLRRESGLGFAVRRCVVEYLAPARLDDELVVETRVTRHGGASLEMAQRVLRAARELARLDLRIACLGPDGRPRRLPPALRAVLATSSPQPSGMTLSHAR